MGRGGGGVIRRLDAECATDISCIASLSLSLSLLYEFGSAPFQQMARAVAFETKDVRNRETETNCFNRKEIEHIAKFSKVYSDLYEILRILLIH